ncbi:MAG: sensor histidine kinase [Clostridiales bacterium]|nr:sensor histidine kinase [Clostridiales bacterium]
MKRKYRLVSEEQLNQMVDTRVKELRSEETRRYEWELLLKQANLSTLQSQINPHFLYNTMECIRGMALLADQEDIADISLALSNFFRYSISAKSDIVTLKSELENVENYCRIQQYRFSHRFRLIVDGAERASEAVMPKLILQPIVENAILHGLADFTEGGEIFIQVRRVGKNVVITVSDNGQGMTPEQLSALVDKIHEVSILDSGDENHTGIGMLNVNRRIKLYFGEQYGISICSCPGAGTDVEVLIPYRLSVKENEGNISML